jgi:hypothetical protein
MPDAAANQLPQRRERHLTQPGVILRAVSLESARIGSRGGLRAGVHACLQAGKVRLGNQLRRLRGAECRLLVVSIPRPRARCACSASPSRRTGGGRAGDRLALGCAAAGGARPVGDAGEGDQSGADRGRADHHEGQPERQALWAPRSQGADHRGLRLRPRAIAARHAEFVRLAEAAREERELIGRLCRRATVAQKGIAQILGDRLGSRLPGRGVSAGPRRPGPHQGAPASRKAEIEREAAQRRKIDGRSTLEISPNWRGPCHYVASTLGGRVLIAVLAAPNLGPREG